MLEKLRSVGGLISFVLPASNPARYICNNITEANTAVQACGDGDLGRGGDESDAFEST
jgi:hypothetical protein